MSADRKARQQKLRVKDRRRWLLHKLWLIVDAIEAGLAAESGLDITAVYVFGSVARGRPKPNDLDLLLVYDENIVFIDRSISKMVNEGDPYREPLQAIHARSPYVDAMPVDRKGFAERLNHFTQGWPSPVLVWLYGERVGPLWEEIYATEGREHVVALDGEYERAAEILAHARTLQGLLEPLDRAIHQVYFDLPHARDALGPLLDARAEVCSRVMPKRTPIPNPFVDRAVPKRT